MFGPTPLRQPKLNCNLGPCRESGKIRALLCLALALIAAIAGCGHARKVVNRVAPPKPINLNVGIAPAVNGNSPIALDLVLIKDDNFWKTAPGMAAKDWFEKKKELQRRYGSKLQVYSWEWVPCQPIVAIRVTVPRGLSGAMVFVNYLTPGTHSAPVPLGGRVIIALRQDDFAMETEP